MVHASAIVFLGDSLTSGYGLPKDAAFPARIAARIDREDLPFTVLNAGESGDTTANALRRLPGVIGLSTRVLVIALGANDALRGLPLAGIEQNLVRIIRAARRENASVEIVLCGMRIFEQLGPEYARGFAAIFPRVAAREGAVLVPYLLDGVGGRPEFNQPDGIHPTARGQERLAENVWTQLRPLLGRLRNERVDRSPAQ